MCFSQEDFFVSFLNQSGGFFFFVWKNTKTSATVIPKVGFLYLQGLPK